MPPTASVELLSVTFPAVMFPAMVALSVACATTDVITVDPVVARVIPPARMAIVANIMISFMSYVCRLAVFKVIITIFPIICQSRGSCGDSKNICNNKYK